MRDSGWHHYAIVVGEGSFQVYQDGNLITNTVTYNGSTESAEGNGIYGTSRGFLIGMGGGLANHPANAIIDDVAVFDRKLTPQEIASISSAGSLGAVL